MKECSGEFFHPRDDNGWNCNEFIIAFVRHKQLISRLSYAAWRLNYTIKMRIVVSERIFIVLSNAS